MDTLVQSYMEETDDMLQKAEECIIRLEMEYTAADINELFRIAHTIKGSSHMVGFEDIGNLMHKIEDMLDCVRNDTILFDKSIVSLCFDGLDIVKKMLQYKVDGEAAEFTEDYCQDSLQISKRVEAYIKANKHEKVKEVIKQPEWGIVSTLLHQEPRGKNKYYITLLIEKDTPMVSPVFLMILKRVEDIGTLLYSSVTDEYFMECQADKTSIDIIFRTDLAEAELYTYFALFYVEKINIVNLTRTILEVNDYSINEPDYTAYNIFRVVIQLYNIVFDQSKEFKASREKQSIIKDLQTETVTAFSRRKNRNKANLYLREFDEIFDFITQVYYGRLGTDKKQKVWKICHENMISLIENLYQEIKGKCIIRTYKSEKDCFIQKLSEFLGMIDKTTTLFILIDISNLCILQVDEIKELIEIKKSLHNQEIEICMIAEGAGARRIMNIFDTIRPIEYIRVFTTEAAAVIDLLHSYASFDNIGKKINSLEYQQDG